MKSANLSREIARIERLIISTALACDKSMELQSEWARYICVLCAGFVENACKEIYKSYCNTQCSPSVFKYISKDLDSIMNPKASRLVEIARAFDETWANDLEAFLAINGRGDAIDSIMANRHLVAHGKSSGISLARIDQYLELTIEVIEYMEARLRPKIS